MQRAKLLPQATLSSLGSGEGPNPWKNVIIFEELGILYKATYLDFGLNKGGVEYEDFLEKNPAGRVPWIKDLTTSEL